MLHHIRALVLCTVLGAAMLVPVWAAEEGTARATASWVAEGRYFQVQEDQALFVGAFVGAIYVETRQGALDTANIVCPGMVEINLKNGTQSGAGRCIITARSGDKVYATWRCAGEHGTGCAGPFTLAGGTGKFTSITGSSPFEIRSQLVELAARPGEESVRGGAAGVAVWPALTYKIP